MIRLVDKPHGWSAALLVLFFALLPADIIAKRVVVDQLGREVEVPDDPRRVICLAPNLTEMVFALGQGHRVAGVSAFSNRPEAAGSLPKVGSYVRPDVERIVALEPDLCLATRDGNPLRVVQRIESLGIPVFAIDPRDMAGVMDSIKSLARLFDARDRGAALVRQMQTRLDRVRKRVVATRTAPRVLYLVGTEPMIAAAGKSFVHELILAAGGDNVLDSGNAYPRISLEEVVALSPEVIILSTMQGEEDVRDFRRRLEPWGRVPAVHSDRIHRVQSDVFDRPSPRIVEAVEILAGLLHPDSLHNESEGREQ